MSTRTTDIRRLLASSWCRLLKSSCRRDTPVSGQIRIVIHLFYCARIYLPVSLRYWVFRCLDKLAYVINLKATTLIISKWFVFSWLGGWFGNGWMGAWLGMGFGWVVCFFAGWMVDWVVWWLVNLLIGWLCSCLIGWLVG